jgi:DMSO/TMAO reductase YedYZ molybdopterin-dependent catalytic subunit
MGFTGLSLCSPNLMLLRAAEATARGVMLESLDAVRMRRPLLVEKALKDDTLLAFGMKGGC